ncbi:unnamed protein product [Prorocentrum cordatum]|uniref:Uncharacterized protein n=1 Tax=Prorocentrum cordatum TaxID=2364126 RepID=A0ABN9Y042_9DINO|nr:unnamed protein product [Polarella glacialis]
MPLLPAGALAGGRSIAPMGSKRISWFLSPRARPHREPGPVGDQTGRHADQRPLGGANGASLPPLRGSVGAAGRQDASSLSAGPALERGIGKVHFGGVESVCEISPISSASSQAAWSWQPSSQSLSFMSAASLALAVQRPGGGEGAGRGRIGGFATAASFSTIAGWARRLEQPLLRRLPEDGAGWRSIQATRPGLRGQSEGTEHLSVRASGWTASPCALVREAVHQAALRSTQRPGGIEDSCGPPPLGSETAPATATFCLLQPSILSLCTRLGRAGSHMFFSPEPAAATPFVLHPP